MDDPFDPAKFVFQYPVFICLHKETGGVKGATLSGGDKAITIFTDGDLAERFVRQRGEQDVTDIVFLESDEEFVKTLKGMQETGATHVIFDDAGNAGIPRRIVPIPQLLQRIEDQRKTGKWSIMNMLLGPLQVPLYLDDHGSLRVTGTRVQLERIINAWNVGATPEGIVQSYDTLNLQAVYVILGWYLLFRKEVDAYILQGEKEAEAFLAKMEALQPDRVSLKTRLLGKTQGVAHAAPAE
jgi:uncharacterized protein (DUF433 family)